MMVWSRTMSFGCRVFVAGNRQSTRVELGLHDDAWRNAPARQKSWLPANALQSSEARLGHREGLINKDYLEYNAVQQVIVPHSNVVDIRVNILDAESPLVFLHTSIVNEVYIHPLKNNTQ